MEAQSKYKFKRVYFIYLGFIFCLISILKLYFTPGNTYILDGAPHSARVHMLFECLKAGEFPLWSNKWYAGYPFLQFYSPLFFYSAAIVNFVFQNIQLSIKLVVFFFHLLSGLTAFWLVGEITKSRKAAFIGGLAYALSPWHIFQIVLFGRFPVALIYAFLPLPFLFFERFNNKKSSLVKGFLLSGICISLLMFSHYGYTFFISIMFMLYLVIDSFDVQKLRFDKFPSFFVLGTGLVVLLLTTYIVFPVFFEGKHVAELQGVFSKQGFDVDSATFRALIERKAGPVAHKGYIGLSFFVLALLGVFVSFREKKVTVPILYFISLYLVLGNRTALYKYIPFVYSQQATMRYFVYLLLFMSILAGKGYLGIERLTEKVWGKNAAYAAFAIILVICYLDVSVIDGLKWKPSHGMRDAYLRINLESLKAGRALQFSESDMDWLFQLIFPSIQVMETNLSSLNGGFPQGSPKSYEYIKAGREWVRQELKDKGKVESSSDFLYLMNTPYLFMVKNNGGIASLNTYTSPLVAALELQEIESVPKDNSLKCLQQLIGDMEIDKQLKTAARILIPFEVDKKEQTPVADSLEVDILGYYQSLQHTMLELEANTDCYIQLSHSYYPYLHVFIDKQESDYFQTALGLIGLYFPKGKHSIIIVPYMSPLRKYSLFFTYLMINIVAFFLIRTKNT